jgi:hypothetical protein
MNRTHDTHDTHDTRSNKSKNNAVAYIDWTIYQEIKGVIIPPDSITWFLQNTCSRWAFQLEKGEKSDILHYQGRSHLLLRDRPTGFKKKLNNWIIDLHKIIPSENSVTCSPTSNINTTNWNYVIKEETRVEGPWSFGIINDTNDKPKTIRKPFVYNENCFISEEMQLKLYNSIGKTKKIYDEDGNVLTTYISDYTNKRNRDYIPTDLLEIKELFKYQTAVIKTFNVRDKDSVNVLIQRKGLQGKTTLVDIAARLFKARKVPPLKDYKQFIEFCASYDPAKVYLIDLPRGMKKDNMFQFWSAVETIKGGYTFESRYKGREKYFNRPVVWVFTNDDPDFSLLSDKRWKLWTIDDETLDLIPYTINNTEKGTHPGGIIVLNTNTKVITNEFIESTTEEIRNGIRAIEERTQNVENIIKSINNDFHNDRDGSENPITEPNIETVDFINESIKIIEENKKHIAAIKPVPKKIFRPTIKK